MILVEEILGAYVQGYFPMADPEEDNQIYWHLPEERGIIPLDDFHIPKNVRKQYNKSECTITVNNAFDQVIEACADREETWISPEIIEMYSQLHALDFAWSVEVWEDLNLIGGLYGVAIKNAFFGESMFSKKTNGSKFALVFLVEFLKEKNFQLLDCQYLNPHLKQFGAIEIKHEDYMNMLSKALK